MEFVNKYPKEVKLVFKQFPLQFHQNARPAAIAALAAHRQGKFWQMHDELFKNSRDLSPSTINSLAKKIGLNMKKFEKDFADGALAEQVNKDFTDGRNAEVTGTPMVYINGKKAKSRSIEYFEAELQMMKSAS
jgi:protein-disulfide isomerase